MKIENKSSAWGFLAGIWFLLAALVVSQMSCAGQRNARNPMAWQSDPFAVLIEAVCVGENSGRMGWGSGVLIDGQRMLTAWHVIACDGVLLATATTANGTKHAVQVDREWKTRDVARLAVVSPTDSFGEIAPPTIGRLKANDRMCASVAWPNRSISCGDFTGVHATQCPKNEWCHNNSYTAPVEPGNSGGAIYDLRGKLVALVTGARMTNPPTGLGTNLWDIRGEIYEAK